MARNPRVATLLPSATEIVCRIGGREGLVGRSHECDHPADVTELPVLTGPRRQFPTASGAIDRMVREIVGDALAVYELDLDALAAAAPDVIVTQDLCDVCAVSLDDVRGGLAELGLGETRICSLRPTRLGDVWEDVRRVGAVLGRKAEAESVARELERRCDAIAARSTGLPRPAVLSIEWLDPAMVGGTWMPELIEMAGGSPLVTGPGEHAPTLSREQLAALDPDVVLIKPCGFDLERTIAEGHLLAEQLPWDTWRAAAAGRVFLADGNAYFNRSGPRLVESLEILAAVTHPEEFEDFAIRHGDSVRRVTAAREIQPLIPPTNRN